MFWLRVLIGSFVVIGQSNCFDLGHSIGNRSKLMHERARLFKVFRFNVRHAYLVIRILQNESSRIERRIQNDKEDFKGFKVYIISSHLSLND